MAREFGDKLKDHTPPRTFPGIDLIVVLVVLLGSFCVADDYFKWGIVTPVEAAEQADAE